MSDKHKGFTTDQQLEFLSTVLERKRTRKNFLERTSKSESKKLCEADEGCRYYAQHDVRFEVVVTNVNQCSVTYRPTDNDGIKTRSRKGFEKNYIRATQ